MHTALGITTSSSKTLLSEALSTFCWEKKQFSFKGRRHKRRLSNLPKALREACGAAENSGLLSTAAWGAGHYPLPPWWRRTQHTSPWQSCEQPAAQQATRLGKGAKTLLKVREDLLWGGLIILCCAFTIRASSRLKEANVFSILSAGFVPMAVWWHMVPVTLPPRQVPSLLLNLVGSEARSISKTYLLVVVPQMYLLYLQGNFSLFRQSHQTKIPQLKLSSPQHSRQDFGSQ